MTINVTQEDIDKGCKVSANNCPIARALRRDVPDLRTCLVSRHVVILYFAPGKKICGTPTTAEAFIDKFDSGANVSPFSFELVLGGETW